MPVFSQETAYITMTSEIPLELKIHAIELIREYLSNNPACREYDLIELVVQESSYGWPSDPLLSIFRKHFLIRHCLYILNRELIEKEEGYLELSPLDIERRFSPVKNETSALSVISGDLERFYLDESNFTLVDAVQVSQLIAGFWKQYAALRDEGASLAVLGLAPNAEWNDIVQAYRAKVMNTHPDRGGDSAAFRQVQNAYKTLKQLRC